MLSLEDFPHVRDTRLRCALAHWLEVRRGRLMPRRRDIDPTGLREILGNLWLLDYEPEERRFRYRLAGGEIEAVYGFSLRGKTLQDFLPAQEAAAANARFLRIVDERAAYHATGRHHLANGRVLEGARLMLPLSEDGERVSGTFGATVFERPPFLPAAPLCRQELQVTYTPVVPVRAA